ncbi:MAG: hypothetical protein ACKOD3_14465 [Phenylobacterium sp.]
MWSMPRNLRKIAFFLICLMALAGFISGFLGTREVAYLPGESPAAAPAANPQTAAPEVTPLTTDPPPPPIPEDKPPPEAVKTEEKPKPAPETPPAAPSARTPAGQDAVGDVIQGAEATATQPPPY